MSASMLLARLADLLLDPAVPDAEVTEGLAARVGVRQARRLLAVAHGIAADRLWAAAEGGAA
ncbi:hypothetical protein PUR49_05295 [Streptomyces sp. BE147]|uniref:hypothetical protein n=1 Tax=Streptomyces sp. BE147 TaxID=3002524 RepID=UPI002E775FB2|nr:hypothetical protein [Streptomyces sp. BE147]MEE1735930.1 hypothetical protein [Streptomyces sp. BE147]